MGHNQSFKQSRQVAALAMVFGVDHKTGQISAALRPSSGTGL